MVGGAVALRIQDCLKDVADWCGARRLQLNPMARRMSCGSVRLYNASTTIAFYHQRRRWSADYYTREQGPQSRCRLWLWDDHARPYCKDGANVLFHLRRLRQISRRLLGRDVACTLVSAFVLSRVDYCNAVLSGLPQSTIAPLQRVLNAAARVVCGLCPRDHVTNALIGLHWLSIAARRTYRVKVLYNELNGLASSYITDMLQPVTTLDRQVTLRSVDNNDLFITRSGLRLG